MSDTINNITKQFLDKDGLNALWNKICTAINDNIITVKAYVREYVESYVHNSIATISEIDNICTSVFYNSSGDDNVESI